MIGPAGRWPNSMSKMLRGQIEFFFEKALDPYASLA
jgi:hypothetical protein